MDSFIAGLGLSDYWWWLIVACVLAIAEMLIPGIFLIWLAIAAAITGAVAYIAPVGIPIQIIVFAVLSLIAVYAGKRWYNDNPVPSADPLLNNRAARMIGKTVVVTDAFINGEGRVKVGDSVWPAAGPDLASGAAARIVAVNGGVLQVEPI